MTIREWAEHYLYDLGMFPDQASSVVDEFMTDPVVKSAMVGRWNDSIDTYPGGASKLGKFLAILLDDAAVEWIDKNCPEVWFRSVFAGKSGS
jgi:hypothetical protein